MKYIIVATDKKTGETIYTVSENNRLKYVRYVAYRGAVKDHDGKGQRYEAHEAEQFDITEARRLLIDDLVRRGDRPEDCFYANLPRIIPAP